MELLLDISRLVKNLHRPTPTGIERVEMAYVQHFMTAGARRHLSFVVTWPRFSGVLDAAVMRPILERTAQRWTASRGVCSDPGSFAQLREILQTSPSDMSYDEPLKLGHNVKEKQPHDLRLSLSVFLRSALRPLSGRGLADVGRRGGWYVNVSQFRLDRAGRFGWMAKAGMRSLFMLHDIIPILHPEYCREGEAVRHRRRVQTMLDCADVIVTNSHYTRQSFLDYFGAARRPDCVAVPLGISDGFLSGRDAAPLTSSSPYFVVVGTIEPRKNLEFLLSVWRRWTESGTAPRARLVIVGHRGWEIETVVNMLDRSRSLAPTVLEINALSDDAMIALMRGAAAVLAPSWIEGFGLPVAEALALGVPVIASDTQAHREVGGEFAEYLSPIDGPAWRQALEDYSAAHSERRGSRLTMLTRYRPRTWADHMAQIETILDAD